MFEDLLPSELALGCAEETVLPPLLLRDSTATQPRGGIIFSAGET